MYATWLGRNALSLPGYRDVRGQRLQERLDELLQPAALLQRHVAPERLLQSGFDRLPEPLQFLERTLPRFELIAVQLGDPAAHLLCVERASFDAIVEMTSSLPSGEGSRGALTNPTWKTLAVYAAALGVRPRLIAEGAAKAEF